MARQKASPTQQYVNIAKITDGVIITKDGGLRMILMISPLNFALKSEQEQNAIIFGYQNFLNSLTFPVQILVQSRRLDLGPYLASLEEQKYKEPNELLRFQISDYIEYVKKLLTVANIMTKRFFITIPYSPSKIQRRGFFDRLFNPGKITVNIAPQEFKSYKEEMLERANVIIAGLSGLGLHAAALDTQAIIELFYNTYNPEEASKEKLVEEELLETQIVEKQTT